MKSEIMVIAEKIVEFLGIIYKRYGQFNSIQFKSNKAKAFCFLKITFWNLIALLLVCFTFLL